MLPQRVAAQGVGHDQRVHQEGHQILSQSGGREGVKMPGQQGEEVVFLHLGLYGKVGEEVRQNARHVATGQVKARSQQNVQSWWLQELPTSVCVHVCVRVCAFV